MPAALGALLPLLLSIAGGTLAPRGLRALSGKAAGAGGKLGQLAPLLAKGAGPAGFAASLLPFIPGMLSHGNNDAESVKLSENQSQMEELTRLVQQRNLQGTLSSTLEDMGVNLQELI
jgi:hypothetical protein